MPGAARRRAQVLLPRGRVASFGRVFAQDEGNEPIELTKEFMTRAPFVWPALNIPVPTAEPR